MKTVMILALFLTTTAFAQSKQTELEQIILAVNVAAQKYEVDPVLITAIIKVESGFDRHAKSAKGALGLMQLMPHTHRALSLVNPFDVEGNIDAGTRYLKEQLERYGNIELALWAYNAGPGRVDSSVLPEETENYINKVSRYYLMLKTQQSAEKALREKHL